MTPTEIKNLGDALDDTAPVLHYGKTYIDFDINRGYVQPVWLCIDTARWRKYGCRENRQIDRRFGTEGKVDADKLANILADVRLGIHCEAIGARYGISGSTVKYHARKNGVTLKSRRRPYDLLQYIYRFNGDGTQSVRL